MGGERGAAARGDVIGDISDLSDPENVYEREKWTHLLELYLPVRASGSSQVIAVAESHQLPDELEAEVNRDRLIAWALVAGATVLAYLALVRVVRQGSETILRQQDELSRRVDELSALLEQNARLSDRIRHAAARSTALTELERRRIGSDLHDGPSQTLAFGLLRLDAVEGRLEEAGEPMMPIFRRSGAHSRERSPRCGRSQPASGRRSWSSPSRSRSSVGPSPSTNAGPAAGQRWMSRQIPSAAPLATKIALYRICRRRCRTPRGTEPASVSRSG